MLILLPLKPYNKIVLTSFESLFHGVEKDKSNSLARALSLLPWKPFGWLPIGLIASWIRDFLTFGTTKFGSISVIKPKPSHCWHAPYGELNENILGVRSVIITYGWYAHAKCSLNIKSSWLLILIIQIPLPMLKASSTDSSNRDLICLSTNTLSISTSILWVLFFSSTGFVLKETILSSILARKKPFFFISSKTVLCSPFLPWITGDKMYAFSFLCNFRICSTICSGDCLVIGLEHSQQCGCPMLAYNSLK